MTSVLFVLGLIALVAGAQLLVRGASRLALTFGISPLAVGFTVVAFGTSAPERAVSVRSAWGGQVDIALGNVVGSNVFNILALLGLSGLVAPQALTVTPALLRFDLPVMAAAALACLPIFYTGHAIARWEGALFFGYYIAYTLYLLLDATGHDALPAYRAVMLEFVVPLTVVTVLVVMVRTLRERTDRWPANLPWARTLH